MTAAGVKNMDVFIAGLRPFLLLLFFWARKRKVDLKIKIIKTLNRSRRFNLPTAPNQSKGTPQIFETALIFLS